MNEERVLQLVREQLELHHPGGITLDVVPDGLRRQDEYWYVPVRPSAQPPKTYEYYEVLAEVESTLEENEQLQVLLVPIIPEEAAVGRDEAVLKVEPRS
jgi:hypothetical protein